eukprot:2335643-Prymnesium_polylepis.2
MAVLTISAALRDFSVRALRLTRCMGRLPRRPASVLRCPHVGVENRTLCLRPYRSCRAALRPEGRSRRRCSMRMTGDASVSLSLTAHPIHTLSNQAHSDATHRVGPVARRGAPARRDPIL